MTPAEARAIVAATEALYAKEWRETMARTKTKPFRLLESDVQDGCINLLKLLRITHWRTNNGTMPGFGKGGTRRPVKFGKPGGSDIELLFPLRLQGADGKVRKVAWAWYVEVKRALGPKGGASGSVQSEEQIEFQKRVEEAGAKYIVVRSVDDLRAELKAHGFPC